MKKLITVILMIFIFPGFFFLQVRPGKAGLETDDFTGVFVLREKSPLRVSIDHGWERDGLIPVVLAFKELEIGLLVDARKLSAADGLDNGIKEMLFEDKNLPFLIYEQNRLRTRMKLLERKTVKLIINSRGQVEFFLGSSRLYLNPLRVTFREINNEPGGLYQLTFEGLKVSTGTRFVILPSRGVIYAVPGLTTDAASLNFDGDETKNTGWSVWALKIDQEEEIAFNRDREK